MKQTSLLPPEKRVRMPGGKLNAGQRSLAELRKRGYIAEVCERWVSFGGKAEKEYIAGLENQRAELIALLRQFAELNAATTLPLVEPAIAELDADLPEKPTGPSGVRKDLYRIADIQAFDDEEVLLVQTTSRAQISAHVRKYRADSEICTTLRKWLRKPWRHFVIHGWDRYAVPTKTGGTKTRWHLTERRITADNLTEPEV